MEYLKIIVAITVAVIGWIIAHYFTSKRDKKNKQNELVIDQLIEAYKVLTNEINNRELTYERKLKLEEIVANLQLLGSKKQIELVKQMTESIVSNDEFDLDKLVNSLRSDLRARLDLEPIHGNVKWLRYENREL